VSCCSDGGLDKSVYSGRSSGLRTRERRDSTQSRLVQLLRPTIGSSPYRKKRGRFTVRISRLHRTKTRKTPRKNLNPVPPRSIPSQHPNLQRHNQQLMISQQTHPKTNPPPTETSTSTSIAPEPQRNSKSWSPSPRAQHSPTPSAAAPFSNSLQSTFYDHHSTKRGRKNKTINSC
jgi:hypothetical protein